MERWLPRDADVGARETGTPVIVVPAGRQV
jgi:hypothetical protein